MIVKAANDGRYTLFISHDECPSNPRTSHKNFGHLICWHHKYSLGDLHDYETPHLFTTELLNNPDFKAVALPVYLYDHSGLTLSTAPFTCPWDSGQVGWIYATHSEVEKEFGKVDIDTVSTVKNLLRAEVKEYNSYLSGECYGYQLFDKQREFDSCWGFLGSVDELVNVLDEYLSPQYRPLIAKLQDVNSQSVTEYFSGQSVCA